MTDNFQDAISARETVSAAKDKLKEELQAVNEAIEAEKNKLAWLQNSYLPLQDLKEFIVQFLIKNGQDYGQEKIAPAISSLATNGKWGIGAAEEKIGLPLRYQDMEQAIEGVKIGGFWGCQIITPDKTMLDDRGFFCLLFKALEPSLRDIMNNMGPAEFGYDRIKTKEIGPGLEERRQMIQDVAAQILALGQQKADITNKLQELEA